ncbi:MAG: glutathione S-transferase family protein [Pseudomonadota bacterium]
MILADDQVTTDEVKSWKGIHLLHFQGSSCSQKVRTLLHEKNLEYESHPIDISANEHVSTWFLGINPRGVVPVLVHDGKVHIESNDILEYLDQLPSDAPSFFPQNDEERQAVRDWLKLEDDLHMDLRNMTTGFMLPRKLVAKSEETLKRYEQEGATDPKRAKEVEWWRNFAENGVTEDAALASIKAYRAAFETVDAKLAESDWLLGDRRSVMDIAWFISANRLRLAGYPLEDHPNLLKWYEKLKEDDAYSGETSMGFVPEKIIIPIYQAYLSTKGATIKQLLEKL